MTVARCSAVVLSPHFDDAVLSCPGWILERSRAGDAPVVLVPFSSPGESADEATLGGYERARRGADLAVASLGATLRMGGLVDAPLRGRRLRSLAGQLCGEAERDVVEQTRRWLAEVLDELEPREMMVPLGAGHHVDHRIAHQVASDLAAERPGMQIAFFEERPAVFVEQSVWLRLTQLGRAAFSSDVGDLSLAFRAQRFFQSFFGASATRQQIRPGDHSPIVVHLLEAFTRGVQEPAAVARSSHVSWSLDILTEWLPALDALAAETRGFVGSPLHIQWATLEYARRLGFPGHYVERSWHM